MIYSKKWEVDELRRAIALCGGGTKGAYELGVWQALKELDIDYQIVTGTSIGSIIGALMTTRDYEKACELWGNIRMEDVMKDGVNLTTTIEGMYNQREQIRPFLKKYVKNKILILTNEKQKNDGSCYSSSDGIWSRRMWWWKYRSYHSSTY